MFAQFLLLQTNRCMLSKLNLCRLPQNLLRLSKLDIIFNSNLHEFPKLKHLLPPPLHNAGLAVRAYQVMLPIVLPLGLDPHQLCKIRHSLFR